MSADVDQLKSSEFVSVWSSFGNLTEPFRICKASVIREKFRCNLKRFETGENFFLIPLSITFSNPKF